MSKQIGNLGTVEDMFVKIKNLFHEEFKEQLAIAGKQAVQEAKNNSPVDTGLNRDHIFYETTDDGYTARLSAESGYAAYLEFGTGTSVDIPDGFEELAIQFKGKGERQINLPARPYLIPAATNQWNLLYDKFWTMLDE